MDKDLQQEFKLIHKQFEKIDERFEKMDERFEKMDERFERVEKRLDDNDTRHENLMAFLQEHMVTRSEFTELTQKTNNIDARLARMENSLDGYAKQSKDYYQEVTIVIAKVNRMEKFLTNVVAPKLGVKYEV